MIQKMFLENNLKSISMVFKSLFHSVTGNLILAISLLHLGGFFLGYIMAKLMRSGEYRARAIRLLITINDES
jgi:hypothetical protein